jgi:hypothetical protein
MAKYEGSKEDMREDARGQKRMDAKQHVQVKGHKRRHPKFDRSPTPQLPMSSPMLATPPGGSNANFGGDEDMGGLGGM